MCGNEFTQTTQTQTHVKSKLPPILLMVENHPFFGDRCHNGRLQAALAEELARAKAG